MPSIKDFEKKKKNKEQHHHNQHKKSEHAKMKTTGEDKMETPKRRPSKEDKEEVIIAQELKSDEVELEADSVNDSLNESPKEDKLGSSSTHTDDGFQEGFPEPEHKIHIEFPGSFILRSKFSKAFETMDKVATDWVNDGDFEGLPVGHPLLQILAAKSLKKAKDIEKKAQNTQAYTFAKIGLEYAKSKLKK